MDYDELLELKTDLEDALDCYPEDSEKHNEIYFKLEEVYETLRELKRRE